MGVAGHEAERAAEMTELLLVIVTLAIATVLVLLAMSLALWALRLVAAYFVLPVEPPGLVRLRKLLELLLLEHEAVEEDARNRYPPPPEIVSVLRAIAGFGGYPGRHGSLWRTPGLGE